MLEAVKVDGERVTAIQPKPDFYPLLVCTCGPDGLWVAFVAPATDGFYQIFRVPRAGGAPQQLTSDPTDKTQPAYAPDGRRLAFAAFTYAVQFWLLTP